ncbi:alpha-glucosidase [Salinigranum salinum]|uniref:alpha-glucosidase n=1 Tax=Salinigranum salinum TaxID=1364937 RepID=UPI00126117A0|nr:alpha-glucosidase [Salinigranum salinum]
MSVPEHEREWWKEAVVYQIYPRSFNDTDGDGVGDLSGVVEKLDYLDDLGVDVVWLCPVYESPNVDNGYDVADYHAILDTFGTMSDWEQLLDGLHDRGMKLIMDLVVNHTSDEHEWFVKSRAGDPDYDDYYWWREGEPVTETAYDEGLYDPADYGLPREARERPPNDWESFFGGPAWTYDDERGEWYLHLFDRKQPDLNWEHERVREEVFELMEWWFEKGIDGFRMDVINLISKPDDLPDGADDDAIVRGADQFVNGPRVHEYVRAIHDEAVPDGAMTVGEMVELSVDEAATFLGDDGDGMSMAFNFDHMRLDFGPEGGRWSRGDWSVRELKGTISRWQTGLDGRGWNSLYLNNHDEPRMVSRFGDDGVFRRESATLLATLLYTLQGTPYLYQGEEIGMTNYPFTSFEEIRDVDTLKNVEALEREGRFTSDDDLLELVRYRSRDNARTPMQWSAEEHAGFTEGEPWIGVNPNYEEINVEAARADSESVWHYYRDLIDLRHEEDVLVYGSYDLLLPEHRCLWAFTRTLTDDAGEVGERTLTVLNVGSDETVFEPPADVAGDAAELLIANYAVDSTTVERETLRPWEARVYRLQ